MKFISVLGLKGWLCKGSQQPHPPLFQLRAFWATVILPIIVAAIVWFCIFQSLGYPDLAATYDGFNRAYEYFKIPLWIAALSLPLAGFYASHHRSVQTAAQIARSDKQISATERKNNFENFIKHIDHFKSDLGRLSSKYGFEVADDVDLYRVIFSLNSYESFSPWADSMEYIDYVGEDGDVPVRYANYLTCVRSRLDDVFKVKDYEDTEGDAFNAFYNTLSLLKIYKVKGVNIRNREEVECYFMLDGKLYVPEFRKRVSDFGNFLISLESVCCSKKYIDGMENTSFFNRGSLFIYAYQGDGKKIKAVYRTNGNGEVRERKRTFERFRARGRISKAKKKKWQEQVACFDESKPS